MMRFRPAVSRPLHDPSLATTAMATAGSRGFLPRMVFFFPSCPASSIPTIRLVPLAGSFSAWAVGTGSSSAEGAVAGSSSAGDVGAGSASAGVAETTTALYLRHGNRACYKDLNHKNLNPYCAPNVCPISAVCEVFSRSHTIHFCILH
jgi:hypothetical protein